MDAIYARQSIDKKDSISIETQIELCKREGGEDKPYLIYSDKGYSGKDLQRPDFQKMLSAVRERQISRIIIYRLDRLSRSLLDFASLIELFRSYGVAFVSTQEKFDTETPMGMAMLNIAMVFAQLERETIQARVRDNYYSRAKTGSWLGGRAPFGFSKATIVMPDGQHSYKTLQEDKSQSVILQKLFHMYGREMLSLSAIANQLNQEQIPSPEGSVWDSSKISRILRNPVYVKASPAIYQYYQRKGCQITNDITDFVMDNACFLYGKREENARKFSDVKDHYLSLAMHQGLIDAELFLKCQQLLDANIRFGSRHGSCRSWLIGLLRCGHCGATMRVNASRGGKYLYFTCQNKSRGLCQGKSYCAAVPTIEGAVKQQLFQQIQPLATIQVPGQPTCQQEIKQAQARLAAIEEQIARLIDMALQGGELTGKYLEKRLCGLEIEKNQAKRAILKLQSQSNQHVLPPQPKDLPRLWEQLNTGQRHEIAKIFIKKVLLDERGLSIYWQYNLQ